LRSGADAADVDLDRRTLCGHPMTCPDTDLGPVGSTALQRLHGVDDQASCRTLQLHLWTRGYQVAVTHSVGDGLNSAADDPPDLLIPDIRMPGQSGLDGLPRFNLKSAVGQVEGCVHGGAEQGAPARNWR
jgi:hypothetical protein